MTGPGTISFWWKVSSESNYDFLRFYIGSAEQQRISGNVDWQEESFEVPAGTHTLKWQYDKDGSVTHGYDCGWVDQVVWEEQVNYTLTVRSTNPSSGVSITSNTGHQGTTEYSHSVEQGTSVTLTAPEYHDSGASRKRFTHWTGHSAGQRTISFTMTGNLDRTANFEDDPEQAMSPSGGETIANRQPAFTWPAVSGATWYQIWINRNGSTYLIRWVEGTTTWTPPVNGLPGGNYSWWARGWGPQMGHGAWSSRADFSIVTRAPGALTQIAPTGVQTGHNLTYRWNKHADATWYKLWVGRTGASTWHDRWFQMSGTGEAAVNPGGAYPGPAKPILSAPSGTIGNNRPTFQWTGGACTWWVRGWGPDGEGPWAGPRNFSITYPAGTWFRVYVNRGSTTVIDQWTTSASLLSPIILSSGSHSWWLGVWDFQSGRTIWSDRIDFWAP